MKIGAIDFETADVGPDSACALGISILINGEIVEEEHYLIQPPREDFYFTHVHGISWSDVEREPIFEDVWKKALDFLDDIDCFAAHNAGFDRNVLYHCCEAAGLYIPEQPFICTVMLARNHLKIKPADLKSVASVLGIPLNHHNALSDAHACAEIVVEALGQQVDVREAFLRPKSM